MNQTLIELVRFVLDPDTASTYASLRHAAKPSVRADASAVVELSYNRRKEFVRDSWQLSDYEDAPTKQQVMKSMKIKSGLALELRSLKSWSQEELALAAGLNLRTIQRIENDGTASLQSKKALASALDIDIHDLDHKEMPKMRQYEFKTLEIDAQEGFLAGLKKPKLPNLVELFNKEGRDGWMLVQILTPELAQGIWFGRASAASWLQSC